MAKQVVNNYIMDDMKKYIPDLNPEDFEVTTGYSSPEVISGLKYFYEQHLPVDISTWLRVNEPDENLVYRGLYNEYYFVRDNIATIIFPEYEDWSSNQPMVTYTIPTTEADDKAKSDLGKKIPIVKLNLKGCNGYITLHYHAFWVIIIASETPLNFITPELFATDDSSVIDNKVFWGNYFSYEYEDNYYKYFIGIQDSKNLEEFIKFFAEKLK